ncbi:ubiquitin carboxyl-terminal hydrolase 48 [Pseudohyphozyma bogoriensis]|nr:ubiquitin carboxyl-terminal hydrolase 48 [Pseudohyphozyma bogoriensis]
MAPKTKKRFDQIKDNLQVDDSLASGSAADLDLPTLLQLYGFASVPDASHQNFRHCQPKWTTDLPPPPPLEKKPDVIVVDDSEDSEPVKSKPAKGANKGKGKAKEVVCSAENCANNPYCLNWLGQEKWEDSEKAMSAFRKAAGLGWDPSNERDANLPVGLKVWYQDLTFRRGVYACLPPDSGNVDASPLFQLQVLFTFLQTAKQAVYDPDPLVASLKLNKTEQQDSQEFSKLFMSLLDHEFKKQGSRAASEGGESSTANVARLVQEQVRVRSLASSTLSRLLTVRQFEGNITYGTRCEECDKESRRESTFLEMEITLAKNCKLEDQIKKSLKDEQMDGDNQYYCEQCEKKVDAVRFTKLKSLPPVLHFSILRFVFNMKEYTRQKSNDAITYPLKLDMGQFLPPNPDGSPQEEWYDLQGVLMHKGQSAYHGHYVAQVHDTIKGKWFLFDDETVSEIEDLNAPDRYDEAAGDEPTTEKGKGKAKGKKPKAGFIRDVNGEILPKSKDAYMLVYTRRNSKPEPEDPVPPPLASARVEELDAGHDVAAKVFKDAEAVVKDRFEEARNAKRSVYRVWQLAEDDEDTFMISKAALRRWTEDGLKPVKADKGKGKTPERSEEPMKVDGECETKAEPTNGSAEQKVKSDEEPKSEDVEMSNGEPLPPDASVIPTEKVEDTPARETSLEVISEIPFDPKRIPSLDVLCAHENVDPAKADKVKIVSQLGIMGLRDLGVSLEPELMTRSSLCRECGWAIVCDKIYEKTHPDAVAQVKALDDDDDDESAVWISKTWYNDWSKDKPSHKVHTVGSLATSDAGPESDDFQSDVRCLHGGLSPNQKKRRTLGGEAADFLGTLFPDWTPLSVEVDSCRKCESQQGRDEAANKVEQALIKKEKAVLKSFDNQMTLTGDQFYIPNGQRYFVIPKAFTQQWVAWTRSNSSTKQRPGDIDNNALLCKHGRFGVDLSRETSSRTMIYAASPEQWAFLKENYHAGPPIRIWQDDDDEFKTLPAICEECVGAERMNYTSTFVKIRTLSSKDFEADGSRKPIASSPEVEAPLDTRPSGVSGRTLVTYGNGTKRTRQKAKTMESRALKSLEISKDDTVKDIKVKIDAERSIPTIYQRLFLDGRELDNEQTVEALEIGTGSIIELYEVEIDDNAKIDDSGPGKSRKRAREEGFNNTGLFGWETTGRASMEVDGEEAAASGSGEASGSGANGRMETPLVDEDFGGVACPQCTRTVTIFLCGTGESGKSTVLKQLKMKYSEQDPYDAAEREEYRSIIISNTAQSMVVILEALPEFGYRLSSPQAEKWRDIILSLPPMIDYFDKASFEALSGLWFHEPAIQTVLQFSAQFQLNDSAPYFFENLQRIADPSFVPTNDDILRARVRTTGIIESRFRVKDKFYRVLDVGGQRSERRKWVSCFEGVDVLLFLFSVSEYDQKLYEDENANRFEESETLFASISNSLWFKRSTLIVFLNKIDLFARKIARVPLSEHLTDYRGPNTPEAALNYIQQRVMSLYRGCSPILPSDLTNKIDVVLSAVQDQIASSLLKSASIPPAASFEFPRSRSRSPQAGPLAAHQATGDQSTQTGHHQEFKEEKREGVLKKVVSRVLRLKPSAIEHAKAKGRGYHTFGTPPPMPSRASRFRSPRIVTSRFSDWTASTADEDHESSVDRASNARAGLRTSQNTSCLSVASSSSRESTDPIAPPKPTNESSQVSLVHFVIRASKSAPCLLYRGEAIPCTMSRSRTSGRRRPLKMVTSGTQTLATEQPRPSLRPLQQQLSSSSGEGTSSFETSASGCSGLGQAEGLFSWAELDPARSASTSESQLALDSSEPTGSEEKEAKLLEYREKLSQFTVNALQEKVGGRQEADLGEDLGDDRGIHSGGTVADA